MPTYDYECKACGHTFEAFQSIKAKAIKNCPECGRRAKRLIGAGAGIIFRGSGFYATDYRGKEYQEKARAEQCNECPSASACDAKKETSSSKDK